jgi:hypothetical protein
LNESAQRAFDALMAYYVSAYEGPFSVSERSGKHYGTKVLDCLGVEVAKFWHADGAPSVREMERLGAATPRECAERLQEYGYSSHWESQADFDAATAFASLLNEAFDGKFQREYAETK